MTSAVGVMKMSERIFNTLQYANRLKAVGVPEKQAEVQADTLAEIIDNSLATKQDLKGAESELKRVETELKRDIKCLEERISERIEIMGYKTIIGLGSMIAVAVLALGFLMKLH
ncbi:MAG: hypothetical protein ACD_21C00035G0003 [uncultured bacterium]|nr:MAG: hypothetical protein ACD_21C00035G0003 [uncultured bacterium]